MTPHMPDQHWWYFRSYEPSDYDDLMLAAQQLGSQSRDDVRITSLVSGCFSNGDRLIVHFKLLGTGIEYEARWRESFLWFVSGEKQRELYSVLEYHCPELDKEV